MPLVLRILNGYGTAVDRGTPPTTHQPVGSSLLSVSRRCLYSSAPHGVIGAPSFRSFARSPMYRVCVIQMPDKSGLPSGCLGAGAVRFGLPSAVRGMPGVGYLIHCAESDLLVIAAPSMTASAIAA